MERTSLLMVVDDRVDNLFVLREIANHHLSECDVLTTISPSEGLALAAANNVDVCLLDVQMPEIDGIELCGRLKAAPATAGMHIILMTAHSATPELRARGLEAGADDFIAKPIDTVELVAKVRVALRLKWAEDALRLANARLEERVIEKSDALEEQRSHLEAILNSVEDVLWALEPETFRPIYISPSIECVYGRPAEDFSGNPMLWLEMVHPDDRERVEETAASTERPKEVEYRIVRADGETRWVCARLRPTCDKAGVVIRLDGVTTDITERKRMEAERDQLAAAIEQAPEAIAVLDRDGAIQYVNPAFEAMTGYSRDAAAGHPLSLLQSAQQQDPLYAELAARLTAGKGWAGRTQNRRRDGSFYHEEGVVAPIHDRNGDLTGFVAFKHDVSREIELESQLRQAQKLEAVGTLTGGIAHDFNNLLMAILGYGDLAMEKSEEGTPFRRYITEIMAAGFRARDLVMQLMAFSCQADQERRPTDIPALVKEESDLLQALVSPSATVNTSIDDAAGSVLADPAQVKQMLSNLCTNASYAVGDRPGAITLAVDCVNVDEHGGAPANPWATVPITEAARTPLKELPPGAYVRLTAADTGEGMSSETLARVFDPYFTTKPQGKGSGLGLAVVHGIVKSYAGATVVASEQGKGSVFELYLPRLEPVPEPVQPARRPAQAIGHERILLVDDEPMLISLNRIILERLGYQVAAYERALDALQAVREAPDAFDLLLTDQAMPEMTGLQLAVEVKKLRPDIPIILATGYSDDADEKARKKSGVTEMVLKPANIHKLNDAIRRALATKGF